MHVNRPVFLFFLEAFNRVAITSIYIGYLFVQLRQHSEKEITQTLNRQSSILPFEVPMCCCIHDCCSSIVSDDNFFDDDDDVLFG